MGFCEPVEPPKRHLSYVLLLEISFKAQMTPIKQMSETPPRRMPEISCSTDRLRLVWTAGEFSLYIQITWTNAGIYYLI